uniref:NADAR domain-containing protein n=1 Tax=Cyanothece sp. (strain PCC 7425 / ATCC 29141) TaxID=395961 RepID=B8HS05_CYAP4
MVIYFYKVEGPYGCFSNFSPHGFELEGQRWQTVEHYYQAHKFVGTPDHHLCTQIQQCQTPAQAAALGRNPCHCPRSDWEEIKQQVMRTAVLAKFKTHPQIRTILLETGEAWLVEDSPVDFYWGCGADRSGQNHLGRILMSVRQELRSPIAYPSFPSP